MSDSDFSWVPERTILYTVHGSRAYGTSRPDSDYDFKGIAVAPRSFRDGYLRVFEQFQEKVPDATVFDIRKFFKLAADCNPNVLEILFVDPSDIRKVTPQGHLLMEHRTEFLSKKAVHTFRGYAISQLRRIQTHKRWLLDPPKAAPTRGEYGLPERTVIPADQLAAANAKVYKQMDSWEVDFGELDHASVLHIQEQVAQALVEMGVGKDEKFLAAGRLVGFSENFLQLLDQERHYNTAAKNWQQYKDWETNRNVARASLEAKHGYDTKHGMHLVRLMRMCREILVDGQVVVRRPDFAELLAIRDGAWSYDKLIAWAEDQDEALLEVAKKSTLPTQPNRVALDNLCQEITRSMPDV